MKTREEVEDLKNNWLADPCYDIEDTSGFEEYAVELAGFAVEHRELWAASRKKVEDAAYHNTPASEATLRDMFAAYALNAMGHTLAFYANEPATLAQVAKTAFEAADAMMAARR